MGAQPSYQKIYTSENTRPDYNIINPQSGNVKSINRIYYLDFYNTFKKNKKIEK